ncbi:MAG: hypothetical protein FGM18_03945 [Burkholderiaceae bacterium]|nr:hypothetical protein [Burkholderiaceae bacterium]
MTDLQWTIVAAAAIVLAGVVAANLREWSQARKTLQRLVPLQDEPIFNAPTERVLDPVQPSEISDAIAELQWQKPMPVARIQQELKGWRHVGSKPLSFGWISQEGAAASPLPDALDVMTLQVGVLLTTRGGPLHAMEYAEWQEGLGRIARQLGAHLSIPVMSDVLARARSLDQRCTEVDAQLVLSVSADQVLSVSAITSAAHSAGLESRGETRFAKGPLHHQRFSVFPGDSGNSLMLLLDVPRTADPLEAFQEMVSTAQTLASLLDARVTDEAGRVLQQRDFDQIAAQVSAREQQLLALSITPGSIVAQRLFL